MWVLCVGERGKREDMLVAVGKERTSPQTVRSVMEESVRREERRRTAPVVVVERAGRDGPWPRAVPPCSEQADRAEERRLVPVVVMGRTSPQHVVLPPLDACVPSLGSLHARAPSLGCTRLPLATGKKGKSPEQYYILCALYQNHPDFRDAAQWLKPKFKDDLVAGRYRAVDFRKFGVKLGGNVIVQRKNRQFKNCGTKHHLQDVERFRLSSREGVVFRCVLSDENPGFMDVHVERKTLLQQTCMDCKMEMEKRLTCQNCIEIGKKRRGCGACKWKQEGRKKKICLRESSVGTLHPTSHLNALQVLTAVASQVAIEGAANWSQAT